MLPVGMVWGVPLGNVCAHGLGKLGVRGIKIDLNEVPARDCVSGQLMADKHKLVTRLHDGIVECLKVLPVQSALGSGLGRALSHTHKPLDPRDFVPLGLP